MIKLTVLYGHPTDPETFEAYYATTHLPLVAKTAGIDKAELTKFLDAADGTKAPYYRMAELWFTDAAAMQTALGSPEGQATTGDLVNFATGGVTILTGIVQE